MSRAALRVRRLVKEKAQAAEVVLQVRECPGIEACDTFVYRTRFGIGAKDHWLTDVLTEKDLAEQPTEDLAGQIAARVVFGLHQLLNPPTEPHRPHQGAVPSYAPKKRGQRRRQR
jgi:hypothetical protein